MNLLILPSKPKYTFENIVMSKNLICKKYIYFNVKFSELQLTLFFVSFTQTSLLQIQNSLSISYLPLSHKAREAMAAILYNK